MENEINNKIMENKFFEELEEMSENKAEFTEYYHKMFEIINNTESNQRALLLYKLISEIRSIGFEEGKMSEKEKLLNFLNSH